MNNYTKAEMTDLDFIYRFADGNTLLTGRFYIERFPSRNISKRNNFENIHRSFNETNTLK